MKKKGLLVLIVLLSIFYLAGCSHFDKQDDGSKQYEIYELAKESGFTGTYEEWLQSIRGADGKDGREIELSIRDNKIVWRYIGESNWEEIYSINDLIGPKGDKGDSGDQGKPGVDGISITKIEKTKTEGLVDTYTIYYSNGTVTTFTVTNGNDGETGQQGIQGIEGKPGLDGHTPVITISEKLTWVIDGVDTNIKAQGPKGEPGADGKPGQDGQDGKPGLDGENGKSAYEIYKEHHPEYTKTEEEWLDDLVNGRLGTELPTYYTVKFDTDGGNTIQDQKVLQYNKVTKPINPIKEGHTFKGWYIDDEKWVFNGYSVTEDITLKAKWEINSYKITINYNNGSLSKEQLYKYNTTITLPTNIIKEGYVFDRWEDSNGNIVDTNYVVKHDEVLNCIFLKKINLIFNSNGGTIFSNQEVIESKLIETLPTPTKVDHLFVGWFYEVDGKQVKLTVPCINPFTKDTTLNAVYRETISDYIIEEINTNEIKIVKYIGKDIKIIIPTTLKGKQVTVIGDNAFLDNKTVEEIKVGTYVNTIGVNAFKGCNSLKKLELSSNTMSLGNGMLEGCNSFETLAFKNGSGAKIKDLFNVKSSSQLPISFENLTLLEGTTGWDNILFAGVTNKFNINLLETDNNVIFNNVSIIKSAILPLNLTSIYSQMFENCKGLEKITINKMKQNPQYSRAVRQYNGIDFNAFNGCTSLKEVYFNGTIEDWIKLEIASIESSPLCYADKFYTLDSNQNYQLLEHLTLREGIDTIGLNTLSGCKSLRSVVLPESLTSINYMFNQCINLEEIVLPSKLIQCSSSFSNTKKLYKVSYRGTIENWMKLDFGMPENSPLYYSTEFYLGNNSNNFTKLVDLVIDGNVTEIRSRQFHSMPVESITIKSNVSTIGGEAFANCKNLKNLYLNEGLLTIGEAAFKNCKKLENIHFSEGLQTIGSVAFYNCESLKELVFLNGLIEIGENTFSACKKLRRVIFPEGLQTIGKFAFEYCYNLDYVYLPKNITFIDYNIFNCCNNVFILCEEQNQPTGWNQNWLRSESDKFNSEVYWNSKREDIIVDKFEYYINNNEATLLYYDGIDKIINIPENILVKGVSYPVTKINAYAFANCNNIVEVKMPNTIKEIGKGAFSKCINLKKINISTNVTELKPYVFEECNSLETFIIPEQILNMWYGVFNNCKNLKRVFIPKTFNGFLDIVWGLPFDGCDNTVIYTDGEYYSLDQLRNEIIYNVSLEEFKNIK